MREVCVFWKTWKFDKMDPKAVDELESPEAERQELLSISPEHGKQDANRKMPQSESFNGFLFLN